MSGIRFFGEGTARIITSHISEAWPVADAGLGAAVYVLEILTLKGIDSWLPCPC